MEEEMKINFTVESIPPSGSDYTRYHWVVKKRLRRDWAWMIMVALRKDRTIKIDGTHRPDKKRRVKIVVYRGRFLDLDNLYMGCKGVIDAMRDLNLLRNDSPKWLDLTIEQEIDRLNPRTEIEIEEA
jgi:Holliday junction resolvase RusA-like endonuclease